MCGFLGEFRIADNALTIEAVFSDLLALSKHRGPDSTEIVTTENFQLGFNRLAILDLSDKANQPLGSLNGRYQLVFNGEIYNYKELGVQHKIENLRSDSDTEIVIRLIEKLGIERAIETFNGMFSIALLDTEENLLYLARDFAGIKPLFYGVSKKGIVFASQFDQIFKHSWLSPDLRLRPEIVKEYFGLGYMQAPNTVYDHIYQVLPGELICFDQKGVAKKSLQNHFSKSWENRSSFQPKKLKETLLNAVNEQLVSDVPLGSFLSGGIDSPLITAYAKKGKPDIEAFTLSVDDPQLNEAEIAKKYAQALDVKHNVVSIEPAELLQKLEEQFMGMPEPFGDYSSIPTFTVCQKARVRHTVILSGDGGDELFLGYPRMLDAIQKWKWFKLPYRFRKNFFRITNKLKITNSWAPYFRTFDDFVMNKQLQIPLVQLDKIFKNIGFSEELSHLYHFNASTKQSLLQQLRWNEFYAHMQRVLVKVDRMSMKNSLEVRVPFLDKNVIRTAWTYMNELENNNDLKKVLKSLLSEEVPSNLINKKKMGFSVPIHQWLTDELKKDVHHHVFETPFYGKEIFDIEEIRNYVKAFYEGRHHNSWGIWHIYAWQKWAACHLE